MAVDTPLLHTEMDPGRARECQPGHEVHTRFHPDRHLPSITTAAAGRTCISMATEIGTATATATATEHLETGHQ